MAAGFPATVREFWKLVLDKPTLIQLAKHYLVIGWEQWKRIALRNANTLLYKRIEDAVSAQPSKCLWYLAIIWGLQYNTLNRLGRPQRYKGRLGGPF